MNGDVYSNNKLYNLIHALEKENAILKERLESHMVYTEKSLTKTEEQLNARLESMNQFRDQLKDQSKQFLNTNTYEANHRLLETKIEEKCKLLETKIEPIQKYIYLGIGGLIIINVAIGIILHFL
jgi:DNA anti-recombination protein RmuC